MDDRTKQRQELKDSLARAVIEVAQRHPALRGPYIFDEDELQELARISRRYLGSRGLLRPKFTVIQGGRR